jgi:hypothetical protein
LEGGEKGGGGHNFALLERGRASSLSYEKNMRINTVLAEVYNHGFVFKTRPRDLTDLVGTLIKKIEKISSYIRKSIRERLQSHI